MSRSASPRPRPSREELAAAVGACVPDVLAPGLDVVFCGINPGLYSGAVGHHFARPGNRFWPVLHRSGFTEREWLPEEDLHLPTVGLGITNIVDRVSARADELSRAELRAGAAALADKLDALAPAVVAVLGIGAYNAAFGAHAAIGEQPERLGPARLWVLPNPSGLQARYQLPELAEIFSALRAAARPAAGSR
ncbi:MAG TPA: G/U mismatch-specific DNA glycosylase [Acidimicrobiales bacterium]|nr:G/U mismatch-specific DNA glycosylase [Acidimicrobiales bacterium]